MVGKEIQIYSSNGNENTYTDLWSDRFFGYRYLVETLKNTEYPIRIKPIDLYYHFYSGERPASLKAVISNIQYALSQEIIPIRTSQYCAIAEGFYTTRFRKTGSSSWQILDRGGLQTIRFAQADHLTVVFGKSKGIIGQRHFQGSLYVYLDRTVDTPSIQLANMSAKSRRTENQSFPFLVQSRWQVWNLKAHPDRFSFETKGFGNPEMVWQTNRPGSRFLVRYSDSGSTGSEMTLTADTDGQIQFNPSTERNGYLKVSVKGVR